MIGRPLAESSRRRAKSVADIVKPVLIGLLGAPLPVPFRFWDGSELGDTSRDHVALVTPRAWKYLTRHPGELGLARAYVSGSLEFRGDMSRLMAAAQGRHVHALPITLSMVGASLGAAFQLGTPFGNLPTPSVEWRGRGRRHSTDRDARSVAFHYDVSNAFYELLLGDSLTYTCGYFATNDSGLQEAQTAKHDLVCRKLRLHEGGKRLLDVGCGWGSLAIHAATAFDCEVVGVTNSTEQAEFARERVAEAGLTAKVEIIQTDYRDYENGSFDAITSIGMSETVGLASLPEYASRLTHMLAPGGRILNHAISVPGGSRPSKRSFVHRYVFPDGELVDVADLIAAFQKSGLEIVDLESLRLHYQRTIRHWLENLEKHERACVGLIGEERTRVWKMYLAASMNKFSSGPLNIHQVVAADPGAAGIGVSTRGCL